MDRLGFEYEVIPSEFEENHALHNNAQELVEDFAVKKAEDVYQKYPDAFIIGADTIVLDPEGNLLGKPKSQEEAFSMVKGLQGKKSEVYTGVALLSASKTQVGYKKVDVIFKPMTDLQIQEYLQDKDADWMDKAGAYAIQGKASSWIEKYDGEYSAILGLSEELLLHFLSLLPENLREELFVCPT